MPAVQIHIVRKQEVLLTMQ